MLEEVEGVGVDLSGPAIKRCLFRVPSSKGRHSNSSRFSPRSSRDQSAASSQTQCYRRPLILVDVRRW